jgi:xanthine dehydrogenase YagS FAD-binding subunit
MKQFQHIDVSTIEDACAALATHNGNAMLNAGGTDLVSLLKADVWPNYPEAVVNIKPIPGLDFIAESDGTVKIGALARLNAISRSSLLEKNHSVLTQAVKSVAGPQIRNVATLGGNLCQSVRCWYYRYPRSIGGPIQCLRKGGKQCPAIKGDHRYHAIMGAKRCVAVCPSDCAVALAALDGRIVIAGPHGERSMDVGDFYNPWPNALGSDEMVKEVQIATRQTAGHQSFLKFTLRKPIDFAIVSVAVVLTFEKKVCSDARIVLGAVAPTPVRAGNAEALLIGNPVTRESARAAASAALDDSRPLKQNAYKVEIARTLVERAIMGESL